MEMPEEYEGWTMEQLTARLEEVKSEIEDITEMQKTIDFLNEIAYLRDEGFIEVDHGEDGEIRLYPGADAWEPEEEAA